MKSVLAIVAGLVFTIVVTTLADILMYQAGVFVQNGMTTTDWLTATAYRLVIAIIGCWLAARIAPRNPMQHALILGGIGTLLAFVGVWITSQKGPEFGPIWYALLLVVTALPCAYVGGRIASRDKVVEPTAT
jgi:peptidoglycan/LPS O-acetylase OafA/YrhL